jgi:PAS domain S-box-containing protein
VGVTTDLNAALLDAAPDAIVGVDQDGRIALVNAQAEELFGYRRDELVGELVEVLVPDGSRPRHPSWREGYAQSPRPRPMGAGVALSGRRRDGTEFPAEISLNALEVDGRTIVLAAVRDVTEQQRTEVVARGLLEGAPDAIIGVDGQGVIALVNVQAEQLFGYAREHMVGQPVELLVPDVARNVHVGHREKYMAEPRSRPMGVGMELTGRRADSSEFPVEISLSSIEFADGALVLASVRDVSDRIEARAERERLRQLAEEERLERRLQQSQRLESLGQLAGGVAHDFNNLLAVISNYASFVAEEVDLALVDDPSRWTPVANDIEQILRAGKRAAELTHQLLAFGRREVVRPRVVNVNEVISQIAPMLRRTLGEHVDLSVAAADDLWPTKADPGQLEQVLVNLAVNARDAMASGGTLSIATANVAADERDGRASAVDGDAVQLRVQDSGRGMDADVVARAFEPFFTTKPKGEGSGLGLATVYGIVAQAGGQVLLDSAPGQGTTVTVLLPRTDEPVAEPLEPAPQPFARTRATILVVEDEPAMREVTRRMLERLGHTVITAEDAADALRMAEQAVSIDLLLTDVVMPKVLGKDVADAFSAVRPDLPVLFMSGYAQPVLASQGTLDDGVHLLEKPFSSAQLSAKVRELLSG